VHITQSVTPVCTFEFAGTAAAYCKLFAVICACNICAFCGPYKQNVNMPTAIFVCSDPVTSNDLLHCLAQCNF